MDALAGLRLGKGEWLARIELPDEFREDLTEYPFHPAMVDVALASGARKVAEDVYLPAGYGRVHVRAPLTASFWSHIRLHQDSGPKTETLSFDVSFLDPDGRVLATIDRYTLKKVTAAAPAQAPARDVVPVAPLGHPTDILPDEGVEALARVLATRSIPQVVVSTRNLDDLIAEENGAASKSGEEEPEEELSLASTHARPSLSTPYEAPANAIEEAVAEIWQGILGIGQIGANDDFTELGGNSLLAVQAVANTADTFNLDLPIELFFRDPTVRGVAEAVVEQLVSMASEDTLAELMATLDEV